MEKKVVLSFRGQKVKKWTRFEIFQDLRKINLWHFSNIHQAITTVQVLKIDYRLFLEKYCVLGRLPSATLQICHGKVIRFCDGQ